MSTQVLTLEQVCKEPSDEQMAFEFSSLQHASSQGHNPVTLHDVFRHLVSTLTLPQPLCDMLQALAMLTMQAMDIDLCVIMLKDQSGNLLRLSTCAPELSDQGVIVQPISVDFDVWEHLRTAMLHGQWPALSTHDVDTLNPLKNVQYTTLYPVPLLVGTECIGLLNCYASKALHYSDEDLLMLNTIANQAALAIKHRRSVEEDVLTQKTLLSAFVADLISGKSELEGPLLRQAHFLGYDLGSLHAVVLIELSDTEIVPDLHEQHLLMPREERLVRYETAIGQVREHIQTVYPGSLIDERDTLLLCLLRLDSHTGVEQLNTWLSQLVCQIRAERHVRMFAGIGNPCHSLSDYPRGYAEAREALELGQYLDHECYSALFNELGVYRYILKFAHTDILCDQYQEYIATLVEYDRRKKTNLLDTLEMYLECGGNIAKTSTQLDVHRNTLLQRLDRLQKLSSLDLEQLHHRLPLLVALKVYRLRVRTTHLS